MRVMDSGLGLGSALQLSTKWCTILFTILSTIWSTIRRTPPSIRTNQPSTDQNPAQKQKLAQKRSPCAKTKGVSQLVSMVLVVMISVIVVTVALLVAIPAINRAREAAVFNEAMQNMKVLDNLVREVASEGAGSFRSMTLKVSGGKYTVNQKANSIDFDYEMTSGLVTPGTFYKEGNLMVTSGVDAAASEKDYDGDGAADLVLENNIMRVVMQKVASSSAYGTIDTKNIVKLFNLKDTGANVTLADSSILLDGYASTASGTGYSALVKSGDHLAKAEAVVHVNSTIIEYDAIYTLQASADFLTVSIENAYYK